jgi:hypothetical protein
MKLFQAKHVANDPQACRLSNPEAATKSFARTDQPFFEHRANCSRNIIRHGPSGPGNVKQIRYPLFKASPPLPHYRSSESSWGIYRLSSVWIAFGLLLTENSERFRKAVAVVFIWMVWFHEFMPGFEPQLPSQLVMPRVSWPGSGFIHFACCLLVTRRVSHRKSRPPARHWNAPPRFFSAICFVLHRAKAIQITSQKYTRIQFENNMSCQN